MTQRIPLYLVFSDRDEAVSVISSLLNRSIEQIPSDEWIGDVYVNFDVLFGTGLLDVPGFHVNVLWNGPEEIIPEQFQSIRVFPDTPSCVFG